MQLAIHLIGDRELPIVRACLDSLERRKTVLVDQMAGADVALAPLLTKLLPPEETGKLKLGVLIFHPSLLPRHRGPDSIKWAFKLGEAYTGATWFWADEGYDTGDICEQEVLALVPGESPREFYERAVIPSAVRMLGYIVDDLDHGVARRRPQQNENATYEHKIPKAPPT